MMQGDSYFLGIRILNNAGNPVAPEDVSDVEITLGHMAKTYRRAELSFRDGIWLFPVSQEDSFGFYPGGVKAQVRLVWTSGAVEGRALYGVRIHESISKEVL